MAAAAGSSQSASPIPVQVTSSRQVFIDTAEEQRWVPATLPRDLIRVIADYYCIRNHFWDVATALETRTNTGTSNIALKNFLFDDPTEECPHPARTLTIGQYRWQRLWGLNSFSSGQVEPYFAVRISRVCSSMSQYAPYMEHRGAVILGVGVSRKKSPDAEPRLFGVDETDYTVTSSCRSVFDVRYTNAPGSYHTHGIVAMTAGGKVSHNLSTRHIMPADTQPKPPQEWKAGEGEGFVIVDNPEPVVVGFDCDLAANTMRVFLNDRLLRVTPDLYEQSEKKLADDGLAVGDPFVWNIPNLGDCYPLITTFHCSATIDFVKDWAPPSITLNVSNGTAHK